MARKISEGETLNWTNGTGGAVAVGSVVRIGAAALLGVLIAGGMGSTGPNTSVANGSDGTVAVSGRYNLAATVGDAWEQGDTLYWDNTSGKLTIAAGGNTIAGTAAAAKAAAATTADVLLNRVVVQLRDRFELREQFYQKPGVANDLVIAGADAAALVTDLGLAQIANRNFMISGTNAASSCSALAATGGVTLTTTTSSGDQVLLGAHSTTSQTAWNVDGIFSSSVSPEVEFDLTTGSSVASTVIHAGLKLTNTDTVATDDDQVFLRYEAGVNSGNWGLQISRGGTDATLVDTGIAVAASTRYRLRIVVGSDLKVRASINGVPVAGGPFDALTASIALKVFAGIKTATTAAKAMTVHSITASRSAA